MTNINVAAVASGAFLGVMALAALVWCFPPITRFLGDLFCCPWRIPFTRKKRRNGDEEMDKDDLPYVTGEPHAGTPVDTAGYQRMSAAYLSAVNVVNPESAMEEVRRSAEYHRRDHSPRGKFYKREPSPPSLFNEENQYGEHQGATYHAPYHAPHLEVPQPDMAHPGDWRQSSPERPYDYPVQAPYGDGHPPYSGYVYSSRYDVQPPEPSYPPHETTIHQHDSSHLSVAGYDHPGQARQQHSEDNVAIPRGWTNV